MSTAPQTPAGFSVVGRYAIFDEIASGGMATVHLGRLLGAAGFSRTVAVKRLHPQFARDQEFAAMFMDEARLAARINHPNVVQTIDVVPDGRDILLVMEYVHGVPFAHLLGASRRKKWRVPAPLVASVMVGALEGLHAAHETRSETGAPLGVVHRDVSPQNVLVGLEGVPRVIDFGVAKAVGKMHATREGQLKGKLAYMSPEQVKGTDVTRLSDVFSAAIVLWEALMGERLFKGENPAQLIMEVLSQPIRPPRDKFPDISPALEAIVMKGLEREPAARFASAREMAIAIEAAVGVAPARDVADWVEGMAGPALAARARVIEAIERAVAAPPSSGEQTRIAGLKAALAALPTDLTLDVDPTSGMESGPKPKSGPTAPPTSSRDSDRLSSSPYDATMPQASRPSQAPRVAPDGDDLSPLLPLPVAPATLPSARNAAGARPAAPLPNLLDEIDLAAPAPAPSPPAAAPVPVSRDEPEPPLAPPVAGSDALDASNPARPGAVARRRVPIPVHRAAPEPGPASLRERLTRPLGVVGAGLLVSLIDFALRQADLALPVRPLWLAEVLVIGGVVWCFLVVLLPPRD